MGIKAAKFLWWIPLAVFFALAGCGNSPESDARSWTEGMESYKRGNYELAFKRFKDLAERGNVNAQFNLGVMYRQGQGTAQDDKKAVGWWTKAAEAGHIDAQDNLGLRYARGQGVAQDWVQADKWFTIAAIGGNQTAANNKKVVEVHMAPDKIAEANALAQQWVANYKKK